MFVDQKKLIGEYISGNQNVALFAPKIRLKMVRLGSVLCGECGVT